MKRATLIGVLALAIAALLALPGSALASGHGHHGTHANRGNHCGRDHAKHSHGVGHSCQKLSRHSNASNGGAANPGDEHQAGDDQEQADENDQDEAGDDQDQGDDNNDYGDVEDDQGEDGGGD
jgi:hypothetical protein